MGAEVSGISLPSVTSPNLYQLAGIDNICTSYFCDIRNKEELSSAISQANPEIVFHLAAQALVRTSYDWPTETFDTNVMGTVHVLDSIRELTNVRVAVMITTDKVYRNNEWNWPYRESDIVGGHDPYSASKAACEIVIDSYRSSFLLEQKVAVASARAGNVIGGGDWSVDRLIPDAVRAWQGKTILDIRRPGAIRPWQHVLEPLGGYLKLAECCWDQPDLASAYNFGPLTSDAASVREVIELARQTYGLGEVIYGDGSGGPHEAGWLALEVSKAQLVLNVSPRWSLEEAVDRTMKWYSGQNDGLDARKLCENDIDYFVGSV
jgi:CDP-glucose 4,6-dehydratase